ncbi:MalY/PatB family protein [Glycomyces terrestris]|uniref:cysteine-S-conjugate beta-lyase n=1 Tax=Glycomyces terrestris TaxID=2493553 RepID=A0A426V0V1_9ACTN|nr:aminotransferase class I/II-fold pyridoxal phosphate-dependent enzyme [Glycomyces terrestris]RRS00529.1 aminotransferase class I/II-fold pyridoxal phosphate-dependent enzyme [Glycomyces terrestris]
MSATTNASNDLPGDPLRQLTLDQLRQRTSEKWRAYPADVLPLWVAEMDVLLAPPVAKAVTDAVAAGDTGYPAGTDYADAVAEFAAARWNWTDLTRDRIRTAPDIMIGVVEMIKALTGPGDAVVINSPVYPPFHRFPVFNDRKVIEAPLGPDHRIDFAALAAAFELALGRGGRAVFLLCSPHNPTGTVHTRDELERVARLAADYGVRVVADEAHAPIVAPGTEFAPYLTVRGGETGLAVTSAAKAWNLPGLKGAVAIAGTGAADDLARMPEEMSSSISHIGAVAHAAAFREGGAWLDALLAGLADNRRLLSRLLAERLPGVRYRPGPGTYLAWLDCRALGLGADPAAVFLDRGRVAVNSGLPFGTGGEGHVRLNYATSPEILTEAVERMAAAL